MNDIQTVDTPAGLVLTDLEHSVVQSTALGTPPKVIAQELGIPLSAVNRVLNKDGVKEYLMEVIEARNLALKTYLPSLLTDIIQSKVERVLEDGGTLADASKKDVTDIVKVLNDLLKTTEASNSEEEQGGLASFYQQINVIQNEKD